jgi:hypothetical protein
MARGKWAQGIEPRHFQWVIGDQLAICERPGGYGVNHRKVRRQEEVIWIREKKFDFVVSLIAADHNLHNYDELGVRWKHWPFPKTVDTDVALSQMYPELKNLLASGAKLLMHGEEVSDRMGGLLAGYFRWSGMVPETHNAIIVMERILGHQLDPSGRSLVAAAERVAQSSSAS